MQLHARRKHMNSGNRMKTVSSRAREVTKFVVRHRARWMDSWEELSIKEKRLSAELDEDIKLVILPEKYKLIEPPAIPEALQHNLTIFNEHEEHLSDEIAAQLEAIEGQISCSQPRIPEFLWEKFISISDKISASLLAEFISASADSLGQLDSEYGKQEEVQEQLKQTSNQTKKWMSFISAIWPGSQENAVMFSGDLRRILVAKKLIDSNLELTELGRLLESVKQQNIRVSVSQEHARIFINQVANSIDQIKEEQIEFELSLEERLIEKEKFEHHRHRIKERLSELRIEREEEIQRLGEYLQSLEAKCKEQQDRDDERNRKILEEKREKVRQFQEEREEQEQLQEMHRDATEFQRKMEFMESLPILKEAAERRERIRQERLEVARAKMREKEEVENKRKKNLERLRNKVRVEVERDPTRTVKNTAAWSERILATKLDRDPIHYIQTYTNSQLMKDQRFRFNMMMREGNFNVGPAAIQALGRLKPATVPRRDNFHSRLFE